MATLEDAAEELVVRLKGLDSEIEESQKTFEELRERVDETAKDVEGEWSSLTEAVASLLEKVRGEQEELTERTTEATQAATEAGEAVREHGAEARSRIADGRADLEALSEHATGLDPGLASLVAEAGEAPAQELAERAREVEQQLAQALDDARAFLQDEVVTALAELAGDVRERCRSLTAAIAERKTAGLQQVYDDWEAKVDELEDYVSTQGFLASHSHARTVVDWALEELRTACEGHLDAAGALVESTVRPLQELAAALLLGGDALSASGADLVADLADSRDSLGGALSSLDAVKGLLASYSFVGA